ncbi:MAG: DUF1080 domain-containing protein, partial [Acidobacteria bacterium]|nr:DUF1080 domain-containing protein [Acidobacteriota bacterium]
MLRQSCCLLAVLTMRLWGADESGFRPLFDGKSLNGWKPVQAKGEPWKVEDGMIVCPTGGAGKLMTEQEFSDFVLRLEYRLTEAGNNGVNIRA